MALTCQAWLEASTKGALLLVSSGETERLVLQALPGQKAFAGAGGVVGGLVQTYAVMGFTTTMASRLFCRDVDAYICCRRLLKSPVTR
jgi:hypothetical protein